jgi:flagellar hook-associated protein 1 FlgK
MSLSQSISAAMSGLRITQTSLSIVAGNVANADTPGYIRKTPAAVTTSTGTTGISARISGVNRELDLYVQRQLRTETSGGSYASLRADFYQRLQQIYGEPGSDTALETIYNKFTQALQSLSTTPESAAARSTVLSAAQVLAQQLNGMTADIQALRTDMELGLADAVRQANDCIRQIAAINNQIGTASEASATTAVMLDQRDMYIDKLSELMDIRVVQGDHNQVSVFTNSGVELAGTTAATLSFDGGGGLTANMEWSSDPAKRTVGSIFLQSSTGAAMDLVTTKAIRSGKIAAYLEMRDQILPQAQAQLDTLASAMASTLSDRTVDGAPVVGPPAGFDVDLANLQPGNTIDFTYTDNLTNTQRRVTVVAVNDPSVLPLPSDFSGNPAHTVIGVDISGGAAAVAAQLNTALGSAFLQFSNPGGTMLRIADDGATNRTDVNSAAVTYTVTALTSGQPQLPLFLDGNQPYTDSYSASGWQVQGFAGRVALNPALLADPSRLVVFSTAPLTASGDATRPNFIYDQLTGAVLQFSPRAGIGTPLSPFAGSVGSYLRQMVSQQGTAAEGAQSLNEGQTLVVQSLQQRMNDSSAVNVDAEMAKLVQLQTAYAANARVMSTVKDLLDILMSM